MSPQIKMSVKQILSSKAYQVQATNWCKSHMVVTIAVSIAMALFSNTKLGFHWAWVLPTLLFGISLIISLPTMLIFVWLVSIQSGHMEFELFQAPKPANTTGRILNIIKSGWSVGSMALAGYATFIFITWASF